MKKTFILMIISGILIFLQPLGAQTWETSKRLTWNSGTSSSPEIAIDSSDNIYLVWADETPGNPEIYYKKSTDGGTSWTTKRLTWKPGWSERPVIVLDSNDNIHVAWYDYSPGNYEIFYKKSTDGGTSWTTKSMTSSSSSSIFPEIAIDSKDHIDVIYRNDMPGNGEIFFKRSTDGGSLWATSRLTWNSGASHGPTITIDSANNIHVAWFDWTPGNFEIYYKRSTNEGVTWGGPHRLTWNAGSSNFPRLASDSSNNIHMVWQDESSGNFEIYYRKGIQ
jgi:hypothetical protein